MQKFIKWLDNYWYHYKWVTIIVAFFVITGAIMTFQYITRDKYDISVIYAGPFDPDANQTRNIETELSKIVTDDYNNDGKTNCQLNDFFLLTDEQIDEKSKQAEEQGEYYIPNKTELSNTQQQFTNQVMAGQASICLLDPYWYELLKEQNAFVKISEIYPENTLTLYDDYSVKLKDTVLWSSMAMADFPEDTLVCFRNLSTTTAFKGKKSAENEYEFNKKCFINLLKLSEK